MQQFFFKFQFKFPLKFPPYTRFINQLLLGLCLVIFLSYAALADSTVKEAEIYKTRNQVDINYAQEPDWNPAQPGDIIIPEDSVRTGVNSRADILFNEGTLVRTGAGTTFRFPPGKRSFELTSGAALIMIRPEQGQSKIMTPEAQITSKGTALFVQHDAKTSSSLIGVLTDSPAGLVKVQSLDGEITLNLQAGQFVSIIQGVVGLVEHFVLPMFYESVELSAGLGLDSEAIEKVIAQEPPEVQKTIRAVRAEAIEPLQNQLKWLRGLCRVRVETDNLAPLLQIMGLDATGVNVDLSVEDRDLVVLPMRSLGGITWLGKYCQANSNPNETLEEN